CRHDCRKSFYMSRSAFASTPTRATPARVGDPGAARGPAAQGRSLVVSIPSTYEPAWAQAPTLARRTGLLSVAPAGLVRLRFECDDVPLPDFPSVIYGCRCDKTGGSRTKWCSEVPAL